MEDFVSFEIAKKLKDKGFSCKYPFAMYDEDGDFYPLFTSCDEDESSKCIFGNRMYYDYDDFIKDKDARIAPTISQVLRWLREEKELHIEIYMYHNCYLWEIYNTKIYDADFTQKSEKYSEIEYENYEQAALAGIEYVLDNII